MTSATQNFLKGSVAAAILCLTTVAASADTLKIGFIDPLSGGFANIGDANLKHWLYAAKDVNKSGGIEGKEVEIVAFDNKVKADESLVQLQKAIDQGIRIIVQGTGSSVGHALTDAISKHNKRNPGEEIIYFNFGAIDPALTNADCNFWHFAFDADVDMKMDALTDYITADDSLNSMYLLAQDYSYGRAFISAAERLLGEKNPSIKIVASELHPVAKVKDFAPYIQKIKNSGASAVLTGNWGTDLTLLIKAADAAGLDIPFFTYYGGGTGAPTAMGKSALGLVKQVSEFHSNILPSQAQADRQSDFEVTYSGTDYYNERIFTAMNMLDKAAEVAGSTDVIKIANALEGMKYNTPLGEVTMRADNHQLLQPLYISTFSDGVKNDVEDTGFGFKTDKVIAADATSQTTTCKMKRP